MIFDVGCRLAYEAEFPTTLILSVRAQRNASQQVIEEQLVFSPQLPLHEEVEDAFGNRFERINTGDVKQFTVEYRARVDCDYEILRNRGVSHTPVEQLKAESVPFLFPSRYCESDIVGKLAWDLFGSIPEPHAKVVAICNWIHDNVAYTRGSTDSMTSAAKTVVQRAGVCRDLAHLGIALCRALNIPARYFTGYAYQLEPPDFHALFECLIGESWCIFDATRLAHPNGLVRIATGRDAAETSVASMFGAARNTHVEVTIEPAEGQRFVPLAARELKRSGVALPTKV
ncbi:MAG: transglutaminase family protein [Proteobacteria bacterium]|nr:MAG: transglutaminase family protein [Pseudomonadota bacterium]